LPDFSAEFNQSIDQVTSIGRQISSIRIGLDTRQAALAADQYSLSIEQARRALKDAKYLTGEITKADKESVGYLQKREFSLNRQSHMAEAKLEAEYAQKQLNIQKELHGLSGDQFMAQARIQVNDLRKQIGLMVRGRQLALDTSKANRDIDALNTRLGLAKGRAEAIYQSAVAKRQAMHNDAAELVASTGRDLAQIANDVIDAYRKVYNAVRNGGTGTVYRPLTADQKYQERRTGENIPGSDPRLGFAEGVVGDVRGQTEITVGEAAGEKVAVVKGPKTMAVLGAGGGGGVHIGPFIFEGGGIDRDKMESLAREISELVESRLGTKAKLVGSFGQSA
jgi:hypothetical protein